MFITREQKIKDHLRDLTPLQYHDNHNELFLLLIELNSIYDEWLHSLNGNIILPEMEDIKEGIFSIQNDLQLYISILGIKSSKHIMNEKVIDYLIQLKNNPYDRPASLIKTHFSL